MFILLNVDELFLEALEFSSEQLHFGPRRDLLFVFNSRKFVASGVSSLEHVGPKMVVTDRGTCFLECHFTF